MAKNSHAVALGRLGGLRGGPARTASLSPARRREIAEIAGRTRWSKSRQETIAKYGLENDLTIRSERCRIAKQLSSDLGVDVGVAEQVLFMKILPAWERLARGLRRSRLGKTTACS